MQHLIKLSSSALARASQLELAVRRWGRAMRRWPSYTSTLGKGDDALETEPFHVKQGNAEAFYQNGRKRKPALISVIYILLVLANGIIKLK